jgi:hypothetical protein
VACPAFFIATESRNVLLIIGFQVRLCNLYAFLDGLNVKYHIFKVNLLWCLEHALVGVVKASISASVAHDFAEIAGTFKLQELNLTFLKKSLQSNISDRGVAKPDALTAASICCFDKSWRTEFSNPSGVSP